VDPMTAHPGFDIEGRIALVTGSSRGVGYALATGGVVHARAFDAASSQQVASAAKHTESETDTNLVSAST
jgi:NAD(P)-dependent dehydrogenase (short-subunit alcohol dehydrogenase family)